MYNLNDIYINIVNVKINNNVNFRVNINVIVNFYKFVEVKVEVDKLLMYNNLNVKMLLLKC